LDDHASQEKEAQSARGGRLVHPSGQEPRQGPGDQGVLRQEGEGEGRFEGEDQVVIFEEKEGTNYRYF